MDREDPFKILLFSPKKKFYFWLQHARKNVLLQDAHTKFMATLCGVQPSTLVSAFIQSNATAVAKKKIFFLLFANVGNQHFKQKKGALIFLCT